MKLPNLAIIFIIIVLPLSVVLSTYMQLQIDVLNVKENYSTKLLDATYDGILSFELNTLSIENIEGGSIKSYVNDAVSTFFTTMSINMGESGASKTNIQSYVPAILFTTYDGYYIYSPVKTSKIALNDDTGIALLDDEYEKHEVQYEMKSDDSPGTGLTTTTSGTKWDESNMAIGYNYMVKPFIYYSATYASDSKLKEVDFNSVEDYILTVNYSLDNHVALYGRYVDSDLKPRIASKSGYLINYKDMNIDLSGSEFLVLGSVDDSRATSTTNTQEELEIPYGNNASGIGDGSAFDDFDNWIDLFESYDANLQHDGTNFNVVRNDYDKDIEDNGYNKGYFTKNGFEYLIRGKDIEGEAHSLYTTMNEVQNRDQGGEAIIDYTLKKEQEKQEENPNFEYIKLTVNGCKITDPSAKAYYVKAYFFSRWVQRELGNKVQLNEITTTYNNGDDEVWLQSQLLVNGQGIESYTGTENLFMLDVEGQVPENDDSLFTQHKRQVIQNSIQYNLNSAISTYNQYYTGSKEDIGLTDFSMPAFTASDWDKILTKVSMATFMQGVPCGASTWGDYAIATSTNNKVFVNKNNLYFISDTSKKNDLYSSYHSIDCNELKEEVKSMLNAGKTPQTYAEMSHEYSYDAEDETPYLYVRKESITTDSGTEDRYKKYYKFKGNWYYWNGLAVESADLIKKLSGSEEDGIVSEAIPVGSSYVEMNTTVKYLKRILTYCVKNPDTSVMASPFLFFEYGTQDDYGCLVEFKNRADGLEVEHPDYNPEADIYSSYEPQLAENVILYDHMNVDCYWCMMTANYTEFDFESYYNTSSKTWDTSDSDRDGECAKIIATAWYTYIGKYRNDQFKMTDSIQR